MDRICNMVLCYKLIKENFSNIDGNPSVLVKLVNNIIRLEEELNSQGISTMDIDREIENLAYRYVDRGMMNAGEYIEQPGIPVGEGYEKITFDDLKSLDRVNLAFIYALKRLGWLETSEEEAVI